MAGTDDISQDLLRGESEFLALWAKYRGEPDDATRAALSEAFRRGCEWGITCVVEQAQREMAAQGISLAPAELT